MLMTQYRRAVAKGELRSDPAQEAAAQKLQQLVQALKTKPRFALFRATPPPPKGLYIWGDVGRDSASIARLSEHDAAAYAGFDRYFERIAGLFDLGIDCLRLRGP